MGLSIETLLELLAFVAVTTGAFVLARRTEAGFSVRRRLRGEAAPNSRPSRASLVRRQDVSHPILAWVQRSSLNDPKDRMKLRRDLAQAGFESAAAPSWYVISRFGLATGLPLGFLLTQHFLAKPATGFTLIFFSLLLSAFGFIAPRAFVDNRAGARRSEIENEFPDALDLMVVCVEAGLGLEAAFIRVGEETVESHPHISREFEQVSQELRAGRSRSEALKSFGERIHVDAVKSFTALLIQTDALGVSIGQALRTYSLEMREHRVLKAEEKAMRIPVLLTLPLVACILPVIVTALLLPVVIDVVRHVLPALAGHAGGHHS